MRDVPGALFFYGVLRPELASGRMAELIALLDAPRPATASGRLYAVPDARGHHPVMIAPDGDERVHGLVMTPGPRFGTVELAELDTFEGFDPGDPRESDYLRGALSATLSNGETVRADAYLWNQAIGADFIAISHGDFGRYLAETGARALPG